MTNPYHNRDLERAILDPFTIHRDPDGTWLANSMLTCTFKSHSQISNANGPEVTVTVTVEVALPVIPETVERQLFQAAANVLQRLAIIQGEAVATQPKPNHE